MFCRSAVDACSNVAHEFAVSIFLEGTYIQLFVLLDTMDERELPSDSDSSDEDFVPEGKVLLFC